MSKQKTGKQSEWQWKYWTVIVLCVAIVLLVALFVIVLPQQRKAVDNFEQCKAAGGAVMETYPEQCSINGMTFTNKAQSISNDSNEYVGMSEADALAKAKQANTPARVVERNGEGLAVTMDFSFGRHNFYVKDGKVYKVEIEGQATDLPTTN